MFNPERMGKSNPQRRSGESLPQKEKPPESFDIRLRSVASDEHPARNEDAIFMRKQREAFGVLDGMGGHFGGDVASGEARDYIAQALENLPERLSLEQTQAVLTEIIMKANERLLQLAKQNPALRNMGTTASVVKIWEGQNGERKAVIANVGDSRVYIFRNGKLEQVTLDDNLANATAENEQQARIIQERLNNVIDPSTLSPKERDYYDNRNIITQALGMDRIRPHIYVIDIKDGDKIIVTSDGIHDNLTDEEIKQILDTSKNNQEAVDRLINGARNRSRDSQHPRAKPDDMSVIVVEFTGSADGTKMEQVPTPKSVEQQEKARFKEGDVVYVRRSSGVIESGWIITDIDPATGDATVRRREGEEILEKSIPLTELEELNPLERKQPEREISISEATSFDELFEAIRKAGGLQGSQKFYRPEELINLIEQVRKGELTPDYLPRPEGLRECVIKLIRWDILNEIDKLVKSLSDVEQRRGRFGSSMDDILTFRQIVDKVGSLIELSITPPEAKRLLKYLNSIPPNITIDMSDKNRLDDFRKTIERKAIERKAS